MRPTITALLVSAGLVLSGCGNPVESTPPREVAECDVDDWAEGDTDCDGLDGPNAIDEDIDGIKKSSKKPVTKKGGSKKNTAPKPKPKTSKRNG